MENKWNSKSQYHRRAFLAGAGAAGATVLAGCTSDSSETDLWGESDRVSADDVQGGTAAHIGMVYALGGLNDDSFNDFAQQGAQRAGMDFSIEFTNREPESADEMAPMQTDLAESTDPSYDLVCCVGFLHTDPLSATASEHPDQNFMIVDAVVEQENVESYLFQQNEGSFQAGRLAGALTTRDVAAGSGQTVRDQTRVGFIGGQDVPPIREFEAGYTAGATHANEDVEVLTEYVDGFGDVEGARDAAELMYDDGADIIYHAAGGAGEGVFQAAQTKGRFAIGVDDEQSQSNPQYSDVILGSVVKRVNNAIYQSIRRVVNGSFSGGEVVNLGLEQNGVELTYGAEIGNSVPDDVASAIETSRRQIISGEINVPTEP